MSAENGDPAPDIRVKETIDETPIRGQGFAHIDLPNAHFGIERGEEISHGELELTAWEDDVMVSFVFDDLGADIPRPGAEVGFSLDADTAALLGDYLYAYAEYVRTGEWTPPEADDE